MFFFLLSSSWLFHHFVTSVFMILHSINLAYCILCSPSHIPASISVSLCVSSVVVQVSFLKPFLELSQFPLLLYFFLYSHGSIPYIRAGIKQASKCYNWALISFRTWFFDPVVSISLLIALHCLSNSSMIPFRFSSLLITIPKYLHVLLLCMFPAFTCSVFKSTTSPEENYEKFFVFLHVHANSLKSKDDWK